MASKISHAALAGQATGQPLAIVQLIGSTTTEEYRKIYCGSDSIHHPKEVKVTDRDISVTIFTTNGIISYFPINACKPINAFPTMVPITAEVVQARGDVGNDIGS